MAIHYQFPEKELKARDIEAYGRLKFSPSYYKQPKAYCLSGDGHAIITEYPKQVTCTYCLNKMNGGNNV